MERQRYYLKDETEFTFKKLRCYRFSRDGSEPHMFCHSCEYGIITTFHLRYFQFYGLDLHKHGAASLLTDEDLLFDEALPGQHRYFVKIKAPLVAEAFEIAERRLLKRKQVPRLFDLALVRTVETHPCLDSVTMPSMLRDAIENFECGFDVADRYMARSNPGLSIFQMMRFPHFLLSHIGYYLHL